VRKGCRLKPHSCASQTKRRETDVASERNEDRAVRGENEAGGLHIMPGGRRLSVRRLVVFVAVAAGHLFALVFVASSHLVQRGGESGLQAPPMEMILLPVTEHRHASQSASASRGHAIKRSRSASVLPSPSETLGTAPSAPSIDWAREAEVTARTRAEALARGHLCEDKAHPGSTLPKCKKPSLSFQWNPEPPTFGVEGLIPYVRLGKHCVVGLGFFGCALGKEEANGHLFEDLKNPNRPRGSVPDPNEGGAIGE
jgi:hypothetical protein